MLPNNTFFIKPINLAYIRIQTKDITFIKSIGKQSKIHLNNLSGIKNCRISKSLKQLEETLFREMPNIIRCHREYMINIYNINYIQDDTITTDQGECIPIGGLYKKDFMNKLNTIE